MVKPMNARIAIIHHENESPQTVRRFKITHIAEFWRRDGLDVVDVFGVDESVSADLAVVHVNLSVVPDKYLEFADRFPVALNRGVTDVRKSSTSQLQVSRGNGYTGPVIVKSNYNYAGKPERFYEEIRWKNTGKIRRKLEAMMGGYPHLNASTVTFADQAQYLMFEHVDDVPAEYFDDDTLVVEKLVTEQDDEGNYVVHNFHFLGDQHYGFHMAAKSPIVAGDDTFNEWNEDPHPELFNIRKQLGFDYGKFDYIVKDGQPVIFDTNKTTGAPADYTGADVSARREILAKGIYSFIK